MKSFEETKIEILGFLNDRRFEKIFGGHSGHLKEKFVDMFEDIELMMKNEPSDIPNFKCKIEDLSRCLDVLMYNSIEFSISDSECKQISNLSQLIYNYNDNLFKDESVRVRSTFLTNFVDGFLSLRDCINLVRSLTKTVERYKDFNPPSFELSKHYIDSIYKKDLKQSDCGD